MNHKIKRYGWTPDLPDRRDHLFAALSEVLQKLPPSADLRAQCPPVYDQGQLGSCTANAIAGAMEFDRKKESLPDFMPSRLFVYYNERVIEGTVASDSGAQIPGRHQERRKPGVCARRANGRMTLRNSRTSPDLSVMMTPHGQSGSLPEAHPQPQPDERLPRIGLPVCVRFYGLRKFRKPASGDDGGCTYAPVR